MEKHAAAGLTRAEGRKFAFTVGAAFVVIAAIVWWRRGPGVGPVIPGTLGIALLLAGLLVPTRLAPVQRAWMGLAHLISKVTTPIMMAVIYFLVIAPVGVLRRTLGRDPLRHRADPAHGYWHPADSARSDLERQF